MTPFEAHVLIQQTTIPTSSSSPRRNNTMQSTCVSNTQTKPNATTSTKPTFSSSSGGGTESILEEALKSHRLNPNIRFKNESLLCTTIKKSCPNLLKLFLEHGADPNLKSYENGRYEPALITAVRYKSLPCVQILLEYGANLGKTNFYGTDAIFQAVHENAFEILECLLSEYKPQQQQSFYNHRHHHDRHPSSTNAKDYQKRQRRQKDVPAALSSSSSKSEAAALPESSSSSSPSTLPPPPHQSINIQKTTTTKGKDSRENKAVVLNREKPSNNANNNSRSSIGHDEDDDGDGNIDDDDHVLCPFYYALNYAPTYPSKRESLVRLLQSYYKCKCLEEIASCHQSNFGEDTAFIVEDEEKQKQTRNCKAVAGDEAKECWNVVRSSSVNFSGWWRWWYAKSVPPAGYDAVHVDDSVQNYRTQQYRAHDHDDHHHYQCDPIPSTSSFVDVDNENDIKFLLPAESSGKGGEGNELCCSNLFPYKIYKILGKCHVIKENESSSTPSSVSVSSSSSSPTPAATTANTRTTRVHKRPSSSYVVLVGPLKLSCITREVIRDQIKLCGSRAMRKIKRSCKNIIQTTTSTTANGSTRGEKQRESSERSGESTVAPESLELWLKSEDYFNRMNFRKSLETLMMPSSLMDYILYRNIHWSESKSWSTLLSSSGIWRRRRDENEYTSAAAINADDGNSAAAADDNVGETNELSNNIKLIKRDLELNINYFAIYIY